MGLSFFFFFFFFFFFILFQRFSTPNYINMIANTPLYFYADLPLDLLKDDKRWQEK